MRTIGIDLSADARGTAACVIDWGDRKAALISIKPERGRGRQDLDDRAITSLVQEHKPAKVGIDSPLGWPSTFAAAVSDWQSAGPWSPPYDTHGDRLRLRDTDRWVGAQLQARGIKKMPQSVSSDRLGATAMRCATLLTRLEAKGHYRIDRGGTSGLVVEVYPAAALALWGFRYTRYKDSRDADARRELARDLRAAVPWLRGIDPSVLETRGGHYIDALVSALLARLAKVRRTTHMGGSDTARVEGSIHLPAIASPQRYKDFV